MAWEFARHESYREHLEYNKVIGNQISCKRIVMWDRVCDAWYSVAPNVLEELNNSMPRRIANLYKAKKKQQITEFIMQAYKHAVVFSLECI